MGFALNLTLGLLVGALFATGLGGFIVSMGSDYGVAVPAKYNDTFTNYQQIEADTTTVSQTLEGGKIDPEGQDQAIYKDVIVGAKQVGNSGVLAKTALGELSETLHISPAVGTILGIIIVLLIAASLLALFFGGRTP